jgi:hypothetical protein
MNAWYNEDVDFQGVLGVQALLPTSMAKAALVVKEYPKLGQRCLNLLFLPMADRPLHMIPEQRGRWQGMHSALLHSSTEPSPGLSAFSYKDAVVIPTLVTS